MSVVRSVWIVAVPLFLAAACASDASEFTQPPPTSVPPAIAFVEEEPASLAFAEDIDILVSEAGLWTEVDSNEDLATCLRDSAGTAADSGDALREEIEALGDDGALIIADCLTGA